MRESLTIERATGKVVGRTVTKHPDVCLKARADVDAVVPWLRLHNEAFADLVDFGDGDLKNLIVCSCGEWEAFDRLLSRVDRAFAAHRGVVAEAPVSIGKLTMEV
jgi:hypothetical protein